MVLLALALYLVIAFALQTVRVDGDSMLPTLDNNDLLFADKLSYHVHPPQRGDIIVFRPVDEPDRDFIKRIIAVPGDWVEIDGKYRHPNGTVGSAVLIKSCQSCTPRILDEPYLPDQAKDPWTVETNCCDATGRATDQPRWLQIPKDEYFVLGDNRNHSRDSRQIGLQPRDNILGRAWVRIWPLRSLGFLGAGPKLVAAAVLPLPLLRRLRRRPR